MSDWWHGVWNDPMRENPWALGMLALILAALFGLFELIYRFTRRRKQETMSEPTDLPANWSGTPIARWGEKTLNTEAAREIIADARVTEPAEAVGEDDGEPRRYADNTPISAAPEAGEESQRLEQLMHTDPRLIADPLGAEFERPDAEIVHKATALFGRPGPTGDTADRQIAASASPQPSRNILAGRPVMATPAPLVEPFRQDCPHCEGTGYVPSISDHLRESIALVGASGDQVIKAFYGELFSAAPAVAGLFPPDLLGTDETRGQRDKLLKALVALSDLYDPTDAERMARLDTALRSFGRSHAAFARPDGTVSGATWEEYAAVKAALFVTLVAAAGSAWKPEYTASWSQAYDYAAAMMIAEQYRSGFSSPRFPRA